MTFVKNGWRKLTFSLFQCSDSTNPYNGSYNEGILIRCVRQKRSIKRDIELPLAIHDVRDVSILVAFLRTLITFRVYRLINDHHFFLKKVLLSQLAQK